MNSIKFIFLSILFPVFVNAQTVTPQALFTKALTAMDKVQTARYYFVIKERINNDYKTNDYLVKMQSKPFKVYIYSITSNIGTEVLYIEGANKNLAVVNPNRFPWFNLNLSSQSMLIRKGHQYSYNQSGFGYINKVLQHYYNLDKTKFLSTLRLLTDTIFDGKLCNRVVMDYNEFKWQTYTVQREETITTIANKFFLSDYMIMERNGKTNFEDVRTGDKIVIPTVFIKRMILSIDKTNFLPVQQVLYDDKGIFSVIEFKNLVVNQPISSDEFSTGYKGYGF